MQTAFRPGMSYLGLSFSTTVTYKDWISEQAANKSKENLWECFKKQWSWVSQSEPFLDDPAFRSTSRIRLTTQDCNETRWSHDHTLPKNKRFTESRRINRLCQNSVNVTSLLLHMFLHLASIVETFFRWHWMQHDVMWERIRSRQHRGHRCRQPRRLHTRWRQWLAVAWLQDETKQAKTNYSV